MTPTIAFIVAGVSTFFGCLMLARRWAQVTRWQRTKATVVHIIQDPSGDCPAYAPVFRFTPVGRGEAITVESRLFTPGGRAPIGSELEVLYDPNCPTNAAVSSRLALYFPAIWLFCVAAVFGLGGTLIRLGMLK